MMSPNACFRQETSPKNFEYLVSIVRVKLWWISMQVGCAEKTTIMSVYIGACHEISTLKIVHLFRDKLCREIVRTILETAFARSMLTTNY